MIAIKTFDILEEFKNCIINAPKEVKDDFEFWCLGKNRADTYDISISLEEYINKIKMIINGTYDKSFNYVTYVALNDRYELIFNEYYDTNYEGLFKTKININQIYKLKNLNNAVYSCFLTEANPHTKFKMSFRSFIANCCWVLVTHERHISFNDFTLLKTAAYWNYYFKKHFNWLNDYDYLFILHNKNKIMFSDKILTNDEIKKYKINNVNNKQVLHSLIYEK